MTNEPCRECDGTGLIYGTIHPTFGQIVSECEACDGAGVKP